MATSSITTPVRVTREEDAKAICNAFDAFELDQRSFPHLPPMAQGAYEKMKGDIESIFSTLVVKK